MTGFDETVPPDDEPVSDDRVQGRAGLSPEEQAAGSDNPDAQARVILEDSDERTEHPEETQRTSTQTPDHDD